MGFSTVATRKSAGFMIPVSGFGEPPVAMGTVFKTGQVAKEMGEFHEGDLHEQGVGLLI